MISQEAKLQKGLLLHLCYTTAFIQLSDKSLNEFKIFSEISTSLSLILKFSMSDLTK